MLTSFIVGGNDLHDIDWNLISPPIKEFLLSLSNKTKEKINIPLKMNSSKTQNKAVVGVLNMALDINEENKIKENEINKDSKEKVRKISAPSSFLVMQ